MKKYLRPMLFFISFCVLCILFLTSCTTLDPRYAGEEKRPPSLEETLNSQIGIMTYDDALMAWGEPVSIVQGDEIFVATWGGERGGNAVFPIGNMFVAMPFESGWKLLLSFNKETKRLVTWRYNKW
jgi:hypothetical protein